MKSDALLSIAGHRAASDPPGGDLRSDTVLRRALREQLTGDLAAAAAAPAIFLISHPEFDAAALRAAGLIYGTYPGQSAAYLGFLLLEEAATRAPATPDSSPSTAGSHRSSAEGSQDDGPRGRLAGHVRAQLALGGAEGVARFVLARESVLLSQLLHSIHALRNERPKGMLGGAFDDCLGLVETSVRSVFNVHAAAEPLS